MNSSALKDNNGRAGFRGVKGFSLTVPLEVPKKAGMKRQREEKEGGGEKRIGLTACRRLGCRRKTNKKRGVT